jgi:type I restriction enzyme S subunit
VRPKQYDDENRIRTGAELARYWVVQPGQLIVNPMWLSHGSIDAASIPGVISPDYRVYDLAARADPRFIAYLLKTNEYLGLYELFVRGDTTYDRRVSKQDFHSIPIVVPSKPEQRAIADFLDRKTAAIDALVDKKERLLQLLEERQRATVAHYTTKGLNPHGPMKESGVEWLGRVPAHWTVKRLKYAAMFQRGRDLPADSRTPGMFPVVSSGGVIGTHSVAAARGPGVVTGRYGSIGEFTFVEHDYWPLNTALFTRELWGNSARWLWFAVSVLAPLFVMESKKSAVPGVDRNDLHPYQLAVPPRDEQESLVSFLEQALKAHTTKVTVLRASVERLREYRQALITAAVTGQLDIPAQPEAA